MKSLLLFVLLTVSGTLFCQKTFDVYDSYTLELIGAVDIAAVENSAIEVTSPRPGFYSVNDIKKGTQLSFGKRGYETQFFDCENNKPETHTILLVPTEELLNEHKAKHPFYASLFSGTDENNTEKASDTGVDKSSAETEQNDSILTIVEQQAEFPGGRDELMKYLMKNIRYPEEARDLNISGKVYLMFVVSTTGKISNVKIKKSVNLPIDAEAYRVVKNMPDWTPAYVNGKPVNSYFALPINFRLQ